MQKKIAFILTLAIAVLATGGAGTASAATPYLHINQKMNYQGLLANSSGTPITGTTNLVFRIYSQASGGGALWTETQSSVIVANGIFNVVLGSVTPITIPFRKEYWLEIQVELETMSPRHLLTNTAYAMASRTVVYQQVMTVALDGGDISTVYGALQMIAAENPTPGSGDQWVIEVQAGNFTETNAITLPDGVCLRGQGGAATTINMPNLPLSMGSYCGIENMTINMTGTSGRISMASAIGSYIRNCSIITAQATPYIITMQGTTNCDFSNNKVLAQTSGLYVLYIQTAQDTRVENNFIDFTQLSNATGIYATNITRSMVLRNTLYFLGATNSCYGIQVNNNVSSSRIDYNVMYGEATTPQANDIYSSGIGAYPNRAGGHTGPYGICNHGSSGAELPAF
jgi:hypothetical protein